MNIQITFKEASELNFKNVTIQLSKSGLIYFRPEKRIYLLRNWINDDNQDYEFDSLSDARKYAKRKGFIDYDINVYQDIKDRFWKKQYQYINGELEFVDEQ